MSPTAPTRSFASLSVAPCVWLAHFVSVYALTALTCEFAIHAGDAAGALNRGIVTVLTLVGVGASAYAISMHRRDWRGRSWNTHAPDIFLAQTNVFLQVLAIVGMIWVAVPAFVITPCDA